MERNMKARTMFHRWRAAEEIQDIFDFLVEGFRFSVVLVLCLDSVDCSV